MKLIVGLGNPGDQYKDTRHNIGFMVVDKLAHELGRESLTWEQNKSLNASIAKVGEVLLMKPMTFMNNSGIAVKKVLDYFKINPEDMWVIHDDIDLPIGKVRIRLGGASAGHNGMESVMKYVGTDKFVRFRLGIGRGKEANIKNTDQNLRHRSVIHFVLSHFTQSEAGSLKHLVKHGVEAVRIALTDGIDKAMNRFN
jgi:peptidyl-tRNA hydrolase, PTH1 family